MQDFLKTLPLAVLLLTSVQVDFAYSQNFRSPSRDAKSRYETCVKNKLVVLDDRVSDAKTIAEGLSFACTSEMDDYIESMVPADDARAVRFKKKSTMEEVQNKLLLNQVLESRSTKGR